MKRKKRAFDAEVFLQSVGASRRVGGVPQEADHLLSRRQCRQRNVRPEWQCETNGSE